MILEEHVPSCGLCGGTVGEGWRCQHCAAGVCDVCGEWSRSVEAGLCLPCEEEIEAQESADAAVLCSGCPVHAGVRS